MKKDLVIKQHKHAIGKDGRLKPQYQDLPRFQVIVEYEKAFKKNFFQNLVKMHTRVSKKMAEISIKK